MNYFFLFLHSLLRWAVLVSLVYAIYRAYKGYTAHSTFTKADNAVRHWAATIANIADGRDNSIYPKLCSKIFLAQLQHRYTRG